MHANVHMRKHTQYIYTVNLNILMHVILQHVIKETKKLELNNTFVVNVVNGLAII